MGCFIDREYKLREKDGDREKKDKDRQPEAGTDRDRDRDWVRGDRKEERGWKRHVVRGRLRVVGKLMRVESDREESERERERGKRKKERKGTKIGMSRLIKHSEKRWNGKHVLDCPVRQILILRYQQPKQTLPQSAQRQGDVKTSSHCIKCKIWGYDMSANHVNSNYIKKNQIIWYR